MKNKVNAVSTGYSRTTSKYWMRRESLPSVFSWPGWLWLLGLLLLVLWAVFVTAPHIEREVQHEVAGELAASQNHLGFSNIDVSASGQGVLVTAKGLAENEGLAEAISLSAKCATRFFGDLSCPIDVNVAVEADGATEVAEQVPVAVPVESVAHNFTAVSDGSSIVLRGEVPSVEARQAIADELSQTHDSVDNQLTVSELQSPNNDVWAALQAGQMLSLAERGKVSWNDGELSAALLAKSENEAAVRALFERDGAPGQYGELELQLLETVNRCDQEFAKLLSENSIQFNTGSASISPQSDQLLQTVAQLAANCDMQLDVEGHTDSVGSAELNKALSLARANAVVESLVLHGADAARFSAYGFGPDRPIADNETADGRRQNRRIEIRVTKIN
ncbi:MAG: OmpA family protein [Pseudomonadales bacterium]